MAGKKNIEKTDKPKSTKSKKVVTTKKTPIKKVTSKTAVKNIEQDTIDLDDTRMLSSLREELKQEVHTPNTKVLKNKKKPLNKEIRIPFNNRKPVAKHDGIKKALKALSMVVMSVLLLICAFLVVYIGVNKVSQAQGKTPPLGLYTIISPSMTPKIKVYDVVFVVKTNPEEIEIGDIISYYSTNDYFNGIPITHRVVEKYNTNEGIIFRTQGDANPTMDNEIILSNNVVGVVKMRIPQLGRIQFFLSSKMGWIIAILVPALGVLSYDILKLFNLLRLKNEISKTKTAIK